MLGIARAGDRSRKKKEKNSGGVGTDGITFLAGEIVIVLW